MSDDKIDLYGAAAMRLETADMTVEVRPDGMTATVQDPKTKHIAVLGIRRENGRWAVFQEAVQDGVSYIWKPDREATVRLGEMMAEWAQGVSAE